MVCVYTQKKRPDVFGSLVVNFLRKFQTIYVIFILTYVLIKVHKHAHYTTTFPLSALPSIYPSLTLVTLFL